MVNRKEWHPLPAHAKVRGPPFPFRPPARANLPMSRPLRALAALALALALLPAFAAPSPPLTPDWPFDVLKLKNGVIHKGLLLDEGPEGVKFQIVRRAPGKPTVSLRLMFTKGEVAALTKL